MKKVFFLTKHQPPFICGVGDYTNQLVNKLGYCGNFFGLICESNILFDSHSLYKKNIYPVITEWNWKMLYELPRFLNILKADALCVQYVPNNFSKKGVPFYLVVLILLLRLNGIKTYIFFHEIRIRISFRKHGIYKLFFGVNQMLLAYCLCLISKPIGTTTKLYQSYLKPFNVPILPVPSNFIHFRFNEISKYSIFSNSGIIVYVFSIRLTEVVLKALSDVKKCGIIYFLHVIGYIDPLKKIFLQELIDKYLEKENYCFHENYSNYFISSIISSSSVCIHHEPIDIDGAGGISTKSGLALSAFGTGCCLVGSTGDMTDSNFFKPDFNYISDRFSSSDELCKKLSFLFLNPEKIKYIGRNAYQSYLEFCSISVISKKYLEHFRD